MQNGWLCTLSNYKTPMSYEFLRNYLDFLLNWINAFNLPVQREVILHYSVECIDGPFSFVGIKFSKTA